MNAVVKAVIFAVTYVTLTSAQEVTLSAPAQNITEDFRIDGKREVLVAFQHAIPLPNGGVLLDQGYDREIRFYNARGQREKVFGRRGEGPGEFQRVGRVGQIGDGIWILDPVSARVTVLSPVGTLERTITIPTTKFNFLTLLPSGKMIARVEDAAGNGQTAIVGLDSTGREEIRLKEFESYRNPPGTTAILVSTRIGAFNVPGGWAQIPLCDIPTNGTRLTCVSIAEGEGSGSFLHITSIATNGDSLLNRRIRFQAQAVSPRQADSMVTALLSRIGGVTATQRVALRASVPAILKPVVDIRAARDGAVWLKLRGSSTQPQTWIRIDASGRPTGTITLPVRSSGILEADSTHIWTSEPDLDGVPSLVRYRVG